jgi:uncharacterized protein YbjT (DUF2867 family)
MILLTGATGTAGSFIVDDFVRQHEPVRVLVRNRKKAAELEKAPTVQIVEGDMSKQSTLGRALDSVDRVLMISAPLIDMVETQSAFVDASKAAGVRHVIKFSGLDARPETTFPFGLMHKQIEEHLERSGLMWTKFSADGLYAGVLTRGAEHHSGGCFLLGAC